MASPAGDAVGPTPRLPALEVEALVRRYGATVALAGLDLRAAAGEVTAVLGPNGAGKTTAVECCTGLRRPHAGSVRVLGLDPWRDRAALRPRVGVVLQDGGLPSAARPLGLLRHLARFYARPRDVGVLAERLGLHACARTPVRRLSGGQRRRLAVAAALVGDPDLAFLDEPGVGLDVQARLVVDDLVREVVAGGAAVVLTTHDIDEAERLADHVVVVDGGRAVVAGSPAALTGAGSGAGTVRFDAPPSLDLDVLRRALPTGVVVSEAGRGRYLVDGDVDARVVASVASWCAAHGVMPDHLVVGRRTLEDVFLDVTGRVLR